MKVSIHAPARGATTNDTVQTRKAMFQSTRPHGARPNCTPPSSINDMFQSTRPHGARRSGFKLWRLQYSFNPRARTGRDVYARRRVEIQAVSIHAPARGATASDPRFNTLHRFQSTRPHGARRLSTGFGGCTLRCFNPRARTGRDLLVMTVLRS